jgi:hypothetical protein
MMLSDKVLNSSETWQRKKIKILQAAFARIFTGNITPGRQYNITATTKKN